MKHISAIIVFNTDQFIEKQVELFQKNIKGDLVIIDNSNDYKAATRVRKKASKLKIPYIKTSVNEADFSRSHAWACKVAYEMHREDYDSLLIADHDMFPVSEIDLTLLDEKLLAGIEQRRKGQRLIATEEPIMFQYIQPALMFVNFYQLGPIELDFFPCVVSETYLDTGGGLYKIVMGNGPRTKFFDEVHKYTKHEDEEYMYAMIEGQWMHFINGGNWKKAEDHQKRIDHLLSLLP